MSIVKNKLFGVIAAIALFVVLGAAQPYQSYRSIKPIKEYVLYDVNEFFIDILGDVPLYEGLDVDYDSLLIFDKPEGRYIELVAYLKDGYQAAAVQGFYEQSLPMLGWKKMTRDEFVRQNERLRIKYEDYESSVLVRFEVSPEKK